MPEGCEFASFDGQRMKLFQSINLQALLHWHRLTPMGHRAMTALTDWQTNERTILFEEKTEREGVPFRSLWIHQTAKRSFFQESP